MNRIIEAFISRHNLIEKGDNLLVAVSGGPDSMALLVFLMEKQVPFGLSLNVAHVDHGLRGEESKKDAKFVRDFCVARGIRFFLHEPDVAARKTKDRSSTQQAARSCRYDWFAYLMNELEADKLVFAHHGDDQIETMLMRQIRGSLSGRKGIPVKRRFSCGELIRPFLCVDKKVILDYCDANDISYRIDASNESGDYQRNRIRHHLLPFIKEENRKAHELFQWQSEVLTEEETWLQEQAAERLESIVHQRTDNQVTIKKDDLVNTPIALQRRVIHLLLNYLSETGSPPFDRHHIESIQELARNKAPSASLNLPGDVMAERSYNLVVFFRKDELVDCAQQELRTQQLAVPSTLKLPLGTLQTFCGQKDGGKQEDHLNDLTASLILDREKVSFPLFVRSRQNGDRISIIGSDGTKKLKDLFIDHKIPKRDRNLWPIVTDSHGTILWVPFLKRSAEALVDTSSVNIITLTYTVFT